MRALGPTAHRHVGLEISVKICGVTSTSDARRSVEAGAALIGLNFHPESPRCVGVEQARELRRAIGSRALVVGVFVDQSAAEALAISDRVGLDLLQFHGKQRAPDLEPIADRSIVVLRPGERDRVEEAATGGFWAVLFDAPLAVGASGEVPLGGTGARWDYERVAGLASDGTGRIDAGASRGPQEEASATSGCSGRVGREAGPRLILAGGIGPDTVPRALAVRGVWGLDVCSGVESAPGVKDPAKLDELFAAVRAARVAAPSPGG